MVVWENFGKFEGITILFKTIDKIDIRETIPDIFNSFFVGFSNVCFRYIQVSYNS